MISACPGRSDRMWKTSRIFSSARCSAGDGGGSGALGVMTAVCAALLMAAAGRGSAGGSGSSARRMTSVGTPSSATTRTPFVGSAAVVACSGSDEGEEELGAGTSDSAAAEPVRGSSSELRLNSCQNRAQTSCAPTKPLMRPVTEEIVFGGSSKQPRPVSAGAEQNLRKARASTNTLARVFQDANQV